MKRKFFLVAAAATLGSALIPLTSGPAWADSGSCSTLSGTATFSPGLKTSTQFVKYTFKGSLSGCTGTYANITGGKVAAAGSGNLSCSSGSSTGAGKITWNGSVNGVNYSAIKFSTSTISPGNVAIKGRFTAGLFHDSTGDHFHTTLFFKANPTACASTGMTSATFTNTSPVTITEP